MPSRARRRVSGFEIRSGGCHGAYRPCAVCPALLIGSVAHAQEQETKASKLEGTLAKVDRTGAITLGYREASFPLSYMSTAGPIGYSIDLCLAVVDEIKREIDRTDVKIQFKLFTPETRIPAVKSGEVDIECGSTTAKKSGARRWHSRPSCTSLAPSCW